YLPLATDISTVRQSGHRRTGGSRGSSSSSSTGNTLAQYGRSSDRCKPRQYASLAVGELRLVWVGSLAYQLSLARRSRVGFRSTANSIEGRRHFGDELVAQSWTPLFVPSAALRNSAFA